MDFGLTVSEDGDGNALMINPSWDEFELMDYIQTLFPTQWAWLEKQLIDRPVERRPDPLIPLIRKLTSYTTVAPDATWDAKNAIAGGAKGHALHLYFGKLFLRKF